MILSRLPLPPLDLPCTCGCEERIVFPRRLRHVVKERWRYHIEEIYCNGRWGGVAIHATHYFQPHHRYARRFWRDTRPTRRKALRPRCLTRRQVN